MEVAHFCGHGIRVQVAGAEDQGLLAGSARLEEAPEQVGAHSADTVWKMELGLQAPRRVVRPQVVHAGRPPRAHLCNHGSLQGLPMQRLLLLSHAGREDVGANDLHRRQVAVGHRLSQRVLVERFAEVLEVVARDAPILRILQAFRRAIAMSRSCAAWRSALPAPRSRCGSVRRSIGSRPTGGTRRSRCG